MRHVRCRLEHLAHADYDLRRTPFSPCVGAPASQGFRGGTVILCLANTNTASVVVAVESYLASRNKTKGGSGTGEGT